MDDKYLIYLDRLRKGEKEDLTGKIPATVFEIEESELICKDPIEVTGEAYISDEHLILHFSASTKVTMPCSICNHMIEQNIEIKNAYQTIELTEIDGATFSSEQLIRDTLLLELPHFVECNNGNCKERPLIEPYLHKPEEEKGDDIHYPFSGLDNIS